MYEERDSGEIPGPRHRLREKTPPHLVPRQRPSGENAVNLEEGPSPDDEEDPEKEDYWEETGRT